MTTEGSEKIFGRFEAVPGVGMTEAYLRGVFEADRVLHETRTSIVQSNNAIVTYEARAAEARTHIDSISVKEAELRAELRALDSEKRKALGEVESWNWHVRKEQTKNRERGTLIERREKQIYFGELDRLLKAEGKKITYNKGYRRTKAATKNTQSFDIEELPDDRSVL